MKFLRFPEYLGDESLLSYLYRFSNANACSLDWILTELKLNYNIINSINSTNKIESIKKISEITGLMPEEIK